MAIKKGWIVFFIVSGVFVFFGALFIFAIVSALNDKPVVKKDTVLRVNLTGLITEKFPRDAFSRQFEGANGQMHDIRKSLAMAKKDERLLGVYVRIGNPGIGWSKAQEIREMLHDFKESGKFVTAFMETCDEKSYYVALAADELHLQPHSYVEFNGFAAEVPFYKGLFNKIGMEPQVDNIGKYKSAGDILKRTSMSPAHREVTESLLNNYFEEFVGTVCETRGLERHDFIQALDEGLYRSEEVLQHKLVDDLKYESAVVDMMKKKVYDDEATNGKNRTLRMISVSRYAKIPAKDVGLGRGEKIALIYAIGSIVSGQSGVDPLFGRNMGSGSIVGMLRAAKRNKAVKAVVLRVDSPGGSALASDVMWAEIEKVREEKPVVVSMSDVAASGGYWMAMGCDAIVAQPLTITGSIGVVGAVFDLSGTYDKLGIVWETVKTSKHADMITDKRPMTQEEWRIFKENTYAIYKTFVQKVADGREKSWDEVDKIAQGRVWTGRQAFEIGLVDSLGGLDAALAIAKEKAGLAADAQTQWIVYPQPKSFFESFFDKFSIRAAKLLQPGLGEGSIFNKLPSEAKQAIRQMAIANLIRSGEMMAIAPFVPVIE